MQSKSIANSIGPVDKKEAVLSMNTEIKNGFPAPFIIFDFVNTGPLEHERDAYNDARFAYHDALLAGDEVLAVDLYNHLMGFVIEEKWREKVRNLVMTAGKTDIVDKYFKGSSYTAAWFMGLKGAGTIAAGDTLASHAGWSEVTPYSGNRPGITWGSTSSGSNTASAVSYSITGTSTVAGAFICTVATGTSGVLYSCSDFAASRNVASGDTLNVTPTESVS